MAFIDCSNCTLPPLGGNFLDSFFSNISCSSSPNSSILNFNQQRISRSNSWTIGFGNINSILGKFNDFTAELLSSSYDVFGLVETKIDSTILDSELIIPGYSLL